MSEKLKPCPFCGGEAYYLEPIHTRGTSFVRVAVECKKCGACPYTTLVYEFASDEEKRAAATTAWNRRATS